MPRTLSFEEKFNQKLKPIIDKNINSPIRNSMSESALNELISDIKNGVDHLQDIKNFVKRK